eukprot:TRINITY_DN201_c0_g2_i7.p1 TRINITY_DN201_c0_g2~~TRINITY_DN201_c0_g2_i7.p1  ORF type:complete len:540 (+),score=130.78 TRINITY_DN201_c0_g2_i7:66-1685(+)
MTSVKSIVLVAPVLFGSVLAEDPCSGEDASCMPADDATDMKISLLQVRNKKGGDDSVEGNTLEAASGEGKGYCKTCAYNRRSSEVEQEGEAEAEAEGEVEVDEDPEAEQDAEAVPSTGIQHSYRMGAEDVWSDWEEDTPHADEDQTPHPKERQWAWGTSNCAAYGCGNYKRGRNCQCNSLCAKYQSCCDDYNDLCDHSKTTTTTTTTPATAVDTPPATAGAVDGVFGHPSSTISYPKYDGFTLMLAEEFDTPIDLEHDPIWTWSDGGLREGQVRFVKEQIKFKGGKMIIEVSNKRPYPKMQSCSMAAKEHIPYKPLVSGELRSRHNMFRYGRYEVRMKAPEVQPGNPHTNGNFIATMFVYRDANAHHWREIDFELTGDRANSLTTNLLFADGTKNWKAYLQDSRKPNLGNVNIRKEFHTYMFEWTPKGVTWYFDGKVIRKGSRLKTPDRSCKIMLNTWIFTGGGFGGGAVYNNRYPMKTEYEYFRFYKWDGEEKYPCKDMSTTCLDPDDKYLSNNNPCDGIPQEGTIYGQRVCKATCHK